MTVAYGQGVSTRATADNDRDHERCIALAGDVRVSTRAIADNDRDGVRNSTPWRLAAVFQPARPQTPIATSSCASDPRGMYSFQPARPIQPERQSWVAVNVSFQPARPQTSIAARSRSQRGSPVQLFKPARPQTSITTTHTSASSRHRAQSFNPRDRRHRSRPTTPVSGGGSTLTFQPARLESTSSGDRRFNPRDRRHRSRRLVHLPHPGTGRKVSTRATVDIDHDSRRATILTRRSTSFNPRDRRQRSRLVTHAWIGVACFNPRDRRQRSRPANDNDRKPAYGTVSTHATADNDRDSTCSACATLPSIAFQPDAV